MDLGGGRWKGLARARPPVPSSAGTATEANGTAAEGDDTGQEEETTDVDVCAVVRGDWGSWSVARVVHNEVDLASTVQHAALE